ncbi:MAG: helix-turn-helix domain-containing protein [Kiritimatiellae bacterium]|nr:helix-turn-helix domain-containing protein [Kiritimatiellia bacterium]
MSETNVFIFADLMRWVEEETGCVVNFHELLPLSEIPALKLPQELYGHHGPFCEFVKLQGNMARCLSEKQKSLTRAISGRPFENICRYGLWDLCYPVVFEGKTVGVLYLGSLPSGRTIKTLGGKAYSGPALPRVTTEKKKLLKRKAEFLADFIKLALARRRRQGLEIPLRKKKGFYVQTVETFINNHYREDISLHDLAMRLNCHPNYLGRMIRRASGKNFRRLLAEFRVKKAKPLLAVEHYSVTDAAIACGFADVNYFSAVFHRLTGMTPKEFAGS